MAVVWKYVITGTFGGIFVGASLLGIANKLIRKKEGATIENSKNDRVENSILKEHDRVENSSEELNLAFHSDPKALLDPAHDSPFTFRNTFIACGVICAFIAIGNVRFYQMWKARHSNNRFDADAFQRGFDRFMNEQAYETRRDAGARDRDRQKFRDDTERFWKDYDWEFEERYARQRANRERMDREARFRKQRFEGSTPPRDDKHAAALRELGISPEDAAVEARLRAAYLRSAQRWHPDKWPEAERARASETFKRVGGAYAFLRARLPAAAAGGGD